MDKKTNKEVNEAIDAIGSALCAGVYFVAGMKIANSNMKPFWKVLCIDMALIAIRHSVATGRKIMEKSMSDDSIECVKKIK